MSWRRALSCLIALVALAGNRGTADPGLGHGVSLEIYYAAAEHDLRTMDRVARRLDCADDPACGP